ncbi:MSS4 [Candida margitis]|uniref:MSS4 n=1 Tax=Candida margitis TaxID=1775924 RepID=UPI00222728C1|nr:MSS4 [Candida margitis]KAI5966084.1 MSS4 [Candida margitis]
MIHLSTEVDMNDFHLHTPGYKTKSKNSLSHETILPSHHVSPSNSDDLSDSRNTHATSPPSFDYYFDNKHKDEGATNLSPKLNDLLTFSDIVESDPISIPKDYEHPHESDAKWLFKGSDINKSITQPQLVASQNIPQSILPKELEDTRKESIVSTSDVQHTHQPRNGLPRSTTTESIQMEQSNVHQKRVVQIKNLEEQATSTAEGETYKILYCMLTGIRVAVSYKAMGVRKLTSADFNQVQKFTFQDNDTITPASNYDFRFYDYAPQVFRWLRDQFNIDQANYLISITGQLIVSQIKSEGKSGSFFYFSKDKVYLIKTLRYNEFKFLQKILESYVDHVGKNNNTLISQFYGLHRVKVRSSKGKSKTHHFVIMNNLFPPNAILIQTYDLKGSTAGRYTQVTKGKKSHTLKDKNFLESKVKIKFGPDNREEFFKQLESDAHFLIKNGIMDYSLLLGICNSKTGHSNREHMEESTPKERLNYFYHQDGGIQATSESNQPLPEIYYLGIIDCLTYYSVRKRLETFFRTFGQSRSAISAVPPKEYGLRFLKFIKDGTTQDKLKWQ